MYMPFAGQVSKGAGKQGERGGHTGAVWSMFLDLARELGKSVPAGIAARIVELGYIVQCLRVFLRMKVY